MFAEPTIVATMEKRPPEILGRLVAARPLAALTDSLRTSPAACVSGIWGSSVAAGAAAVRGGIIDIYLPGDFEQESEQVGITVRIDFFGDEIESIKTFDLDTLGSGKTLESVRIIDLKGQLPETSGSTHLFSYLPKE